MVKRSNIAIIPARGGSKRIPKKNLIDFYGKPLITWTIKAAQDADCFERIIVSTDDPEIAEVANAAGAEVPFLRGKNADDHSPVSSATIVALEQVSLCLREEYEVVVQLMPNCPLRQGTHIIEAVDNFHRLGNIFQISCFRYGWMNPWWAAKLDDSGQPELLFPQAYEARSQDLPVLYCPSGAIWIARSEELITAGTFYGPGHSFFPMPWQAALDIDDYDDLEMALAVGSIIGGFFKH